MKVHLSQIPSAGLGQQLDVALQHLPRLVEAHGPQTGRLTGDLVLRNRRGHVEVAGHIKATVQADCQRCLEPVPVEIDEPLHVSLAPRVENEGPPGEEVRLNAAEMEVSFYDSDTLDVLEVVEDELLLQMPLTIAPENEDEHCSFCGRDLAEGPPETSEPPEHKHPFAALKEMVKPR